MGLAECILLHLIMLWLFPLKKNEANANLDDGEVFISIPHFTSNSTKAVRQTSHFVFHSSQTG